MARMLAKTNPGHRGTCRYAGRGCTCYLFSGQYGSKAHRLRKRSARMAERQELRRSQH
ncbi:hypothetical protein [Streptomyces niveus]|uniref:hypothetical protein n=1 Tax=Streptomyces niveus TaxID=193462 RepID=UPI0036D39061